MSAGISMGLRVICIPSYVVSLPLLIPKIDFTCIFIPFSKRILITWITLVFSSQAARHDDVIVCI